MAKFINVGHRGAAAYAPENTLVSFEEAIARKADMIEFDIRRTLDNVLVVFHDRAIRLPSGHRRSISRLTFDEISLAALSLGFAPARFEDVLRQFGNRIPMNIEIKVGGVERDIVELLRRYPPAFEPILSSFFPWVVARVKKQSDSLRTGLVLGQERFLRILTSPALLRLVWALKINTIHLQYALIAPAVLENLSRLGLGLIVWTVDDPADMRRFIGMGVDGIITNKPDILYNVCLEMTAMDRPILKQITNSYGRFAYAV